MAYDCDDRRPAAPASDPRELADAMSCEVKFSHSAELGELAKALATAQGKMNNASRSAENPGRKRQDGTASRYADLAAARAEWREPLAENGLAMIQMPSACGAKMVLVTMLVHGTSGQWLKGEYPIDCPMGDPQRIGSAITYARRYAGMSLTGLAPEDDDGNAASDGHRREAGRQQEPAPREREQRERKPATKDRASNGKPGDKAEPAWKQLIAFRVQEANDEWANDLKIHNVPKDRHEELTNPSRCMNAIISKWIDEGMIEASALAQSDNPEKRDWKKVHAALANDHDNDREAFNADILAYLVGRRDRAWAELGMAPSPSK